MVTINGVITNLLCSLKRSNLASKVSFLLLLVVLHSPSPPPHPPIISRHLNHPKTRSPVLAMREPKSRPCDPARAQGSA